MENLIDYLMTRPEVALGSVLALGLVLNALTYDPRGYTTKRRDQRRFSKAKR